MPKLCLIVLIRFLGPSGPAMALLMRSMPQPGAMATRESRGNDSRRALPSAGSIRRIITTSASFSPGGRSLSTGSSSARLPAESVPMMRMLRGSDTSTGAASGKSITTVERLDSFTLNTPRPAAAPRQATTRSALRPSSSRWGHVRRYPVPPFATATTVAAAGADSGDGGGRC